MKKALVIYNPNSGKGFDVKEFKKYYETLIKHGYDADIQFTKRKEHATKIVEEASDDYDVVFSIGGDGTLNEVIQGNFKREKPMIVCPLPSGTCNDVAAMLGYNKTPIKNLELALSAEPKKMDIPTINNKPFTYVVGVGKFMNIPYETAKLKKSKSGYLAYISDGVKEIFRKTKTYKASIETDNDVFIGKYSLIMISNSNHIAGVKNFYKDVKLDDKKLEVLLFEADNIVTLANDFADHYLGAKNKRVKSVKSNKIKVELFDMPEKNWCIDGEKLDEKEETYDIEVSKDMEFLVPKTKAKKLFR